MKKNYRAGLSKKILDPPIITNMCIFRWFFDHFSKTTRTILLKSSEMVENIVRNNPWKFQVQEKSGSKDTSITVHPGIGYWVICCYALLLISHYRLKIWPWNFQEIIWALLWVESANKIFRFFFVRNSFWLWHLPVPFLSRNITSTYSSVIILEGGA